MMYVFIDTNIFLSFYHLTSEDLEELEKLVVLIKSKELYLLLPQQVIDETKRNRASKINDSFAKFKNAKFKISYPAYCKDYAQYEDMRKCLRESDKLHAEMVESIQQDINKQALKADKLLYNLFEIGTIIERTSSILDLAKNRVALGNPPGKRDSLGDAINWESLLTTVSKNSKLHLITDDSDFYSLLNPDKFNEFLQEEWKSTKTHEIKFYRKLSEFFKINYPKINLKTEIDKDKLIEGLSSSQSFAETHSLIAKLSSHDGFSQKQAEDLLKAAVNNNQILWILDDADVYDFYKKLDNENVLIFENEYEVFQEALKKAETYINLFKINA